MKTSRPLALLLLSIASLAKAQDPGALEQAIVGNWVSNGQVVAFSEDKAFRIYPKCGAEAEDWKKRGVPFLPAKWEIADGNHLRLHLDSEGRAQTMESTVAIVGGELRVTDGKGVVTVNKRFAGTLPPECPIK